MQLAPPRAQLTPEELADVTATVRGNNPGMTSGTAERIVVEALAFVTACAAHPGVPISPSRIVDEGWHALILHTALYARLSEQLGTFVHHFPERPDPSRHDEQVMDRTIALLEASGHTPDLELWRPPTDTRIPVAANCSHTPRPGGCGPIGPEGPQHCSSGE
jgi:hypothetical protein